MDLYERNNLIEKLYLDDNLTMEQIGKQFSISRNRVKQILWDRDIKGKIKRAKRNESLIDEIKSLINSVPGLTNEELAERLNVKGSKIESLLKLAGIIRDRKAIQSRVTKNRDRNGRATLTKDFLVRLYVTDQKTVTEIGAELNYSLSTIAFNLKRFGIRARKTGRKPQF
jgi:DNA-binding CsgD family transcriptional regulator